VKKSHQQKVPQGELCVICVGPYFTCFIILKTAKIGTCDWQTQPIHGPFSGTTQVSRYQKGKTNLDLTEARDSGWQWHQLGQMQVCTLLQTVKPHLHPTTPGQCPSCRQTNSVKALKAKHSL